MNKLVIVGYGGFAKEVEWLVERINSINPIWDFLGFVDKRSDADKIVGDDEFICGYNSELNVVIAIGTSGTRRKLFELYKNNPNIKFPNLIDPSVIQSGRVSLGEGNIICAGTIFTVDIIIGDCNIVNLDCTIGHDAVIQNFVTINPSVNISGNTFIESGVNVGTGTQIIQRCKVGRDTIIGAGTVVNKDIPSYCTAVGVPARVISRVTAGGYCKC